MSTSVSEQKDRSAERADTECSEQINWLAFYVIGGLMLATVIVNTWVGAYASAASIGLLLIGGVLILTGRVKKESGNDPRYWNWGGYAAFAIVLIWNLTRLAQAWLASGAS